MSKNVSNTVSKKKEAREFCLQFLYHFQLPAFKETKSHLDSTELFNRIVEFKHTLGIELDGKNEAYTSSLIKGVVEHFDKIESLIEKNLKNWKLSRLSKIEHTLLILATYELIYQLEIPGKIIINEALELGKKYSTKESAGFLNGVLDNIYKKESGRNE